VPPPARTSRHPTHEKYSHSCTHANWCRGRKRHAVCRALDHCLSASPPPSLHPPAPSLCLTHCSAHKRWIPGGYEDEVSLLLQTHVYPVSREPVGSPLPPRHLPRRCLLCHRPSVLSASCRAFSPSTQLSFSGSACGRHLPCSPSSRQDAPVCARACVGVSECVLVCWRDLDMRCRAVVRVCTRTCVCARVLGRREGARVARGGRCGGGEERQDQMREGREIYPTEASHLEAC